MESPTYTQLENAAMSNFNKAPPPFENIYDVKKPLSTTLPAISRTGGPSGGILGSSPGVPPPGGIYDPTSPGLYDIKPDQGFPWGSPVPSS